MPGPCQLSARAGSPCGALPGMGCGALPHSTRDDDRAAKQARVETAKTIVIPDDPPPLLAGPEGALAALRTQGDAFPREPRAACLAHARRTAEWIHRTVLAAKNEDVGRRRANE